MTIILNGLLVLIVLAGLMMFYHLYKYYKTSSDKSIRGYDVERHYSMTTSGAVLVAIFMAAYAIILAFTKSG